MKTKGQKILLFLLLLSALTGCYLLPPKWADQGMGIHQPVKGSYHLSKKPFTFIPIIDTTCIYLNEDVFVTTNRRGQIIAKEHTKYSFIRFSGNGIAFIRNGMEYPPFTYDINTLFRGQYCYYAIFEPNILKMEIYNHNTRMFEYQYALVENNGDIRFYREQGRPWRTYTRKIDRLYRKTAAEISRPFVFPTD